jgi:hypothetical protein
MTAVDRAALDAAERFMLLNARLIERLKTLRAHGRWAV